jgi:hypothetical protein
LLGRAVGGQPLNGRPFANGFVQRTGFRQWKPQVVDSKRESHFQSIFPVPIGMPMARRARRAARRQPDLLHICFWARPSPRRVPGGCGKLLNSNDFGVPHAHATDLPVICL